MNQGDLIEKVAKRASISKAEAERAINAVKEAIADSLRKNDKVTLVGFGTFAVSHRRARRGHNPHTAERIKARVPTRGGFRPLLKWLGVHRLFLPFPGSTLYR